MKLIDVVPKKKVRIEIGDIITIGGESYLVQKVFFNSELENGVMVSNLKGCSFYSLYKNLDDLNESFRTLERMDTPLKVYSQEEYGLKAVRLKDETMS